MLQSFRASLTFAPGVVPSALANCVVPASTELGVEFVWRFAVHAARKVVLIDTVQPAGSLTWLGEVHARVQRVAPSLLYIDQCLHVQSVAALLQHVRHELMTDDAKQVLARAAFEEAASPEARGVVARQLNDLNWIADLEPNLIDALCNAIRDHVKDTCAGTFDRELLASMFAWMDQFAFAWLADFIPASSLAVVRHRVEFFVYETFGSLRIAELFDMVTVYPDSTAALVDLKTCMAHTKQHRELVASFGEALERRLLHPGANTTMILIQYVRTIKALRLLDPLGVLLESVQDRVRVYLRSRPETVRCVVTALTNDGTNTELFDELGLDSTDVRPLEFDSEDVLADDNGDDALGDWEPDPVDADPSSSSKLRSTNDILSMLVRIYGSVQVFVDEYRTLLAERLLSKADFNVDNELKSLELLKLRFGENAMHGCALMIKDVEESRRIKSNISLELPFEAVVISRVAWPKQSTDVFTLHPTIQKAARAYSKRFAELKKLRRIRWCPPVGVVELRVSVPNCEPRVYSVAPVLGTLLMHLVDRPEWSVAQLAQASGLEEDVVKKRMAFWIAEGVAVETRSGEYAAATVLERASTTAGATGQDDDDDADDDVAMQVDDDGGAAHQAELSERDQVHAQFVMHMLTNLGGLSAEGIHRNFMLFSQALGKHAFDRTPEETHAFLQVLVNRGMLEMNGDTGEFHAAPG